mmetsp:Transcript_3215/g.4902  ORF Transcript_3215/g.4902 Transcript_3215/m.4902 type:complete len:140 (-) Transcript_3215:1765-2184(-)
MYDFDMDGFITQEDVKVLMSYVPAVRVGNKAFLDLGNFVESVFDENSTMAGRMNLDSFINVSKTVSSEMFYSLISLIHSKLPCSLKFYQFKAELLQNEETAARSPVARLAQPKRIRGLSQSFARSCHKKLRHGRSSSKG